MSEHFLNPKWPGFSIYFFKKNRNFVPIIELEHIGIVFLVAKLRMLPNYLHQHNLTIDWTVLNQKTVDKKKGFD